MQSFVVWNDEIEGRLDCFFYQPIFVELEKKIRKLSSKTLGDYIINISGGATPEKDEPEKYYTESSENGVPFLRVQNVTEEGISLEDCKYINFDTHNGMLKRSQVKEGYLITKITGVGRMAVSSVAPKAFEGNINQHLVAIKTDSYQTSELLAAFLNSDIGERLAFRRSTGGTRPALDYQALKTIPVVFKPEIVQIMQSAYNKKKQKEAEAQKLLDSIDGYVLDELDIKLPVVENKMCFVVNSYDAIGRRLDPKAYLEIPRTILKAIKNCKFSIKPLSEIIIENIAGNWGNEPLKEGDLEDFVLINVLRNTNFDNQLNLNLKEVAQRLIPLDKLEKIKLRDGDLLIEKSGGSPTQPVGRVAIFENVESDYTFSNFLQCIRVNNNECFPYYLFSFLKTLYRMNYMEYVQNQTTGIKNLIMKEYLSIPIPFPPLEIQNKIAEKVKRRISEAERLKAEASKIIEEAKKQVEGMIFGE